MRHHCDDGLQIHVTDTTQSVKLQLFFFTIRLIDRSNKRWSISMETDVRGCFYVHLWRTVRVEMSSTMMKMYKTEPGVRAAL